MANADLQAPAHEPPATTEAFSDGAPSTPVEVLESEGMTTSREAAPSLVPPSETAAAAADEGFTAWHTGKKITALWSNHSNRNSWIAVSGMGWKKLATSNDSSVVNLTMIASHAEQTNASVNVRIEPDGRVHEIYAW